MADLKSLKIKTGICKRVMKEMQSYEAEAEREFAKVENMKKNHADLSDIKQQVAFEINSQTIFIIIIIIIWL
jgi:tubulin-specific chaperone A